MIAVSGLWLLPLRLGTFIIRPPCCGSSCNILQAESHVRDIPHSVFSYLARVSVPDPSTPPEKTTCTVHTMLTHARAFMSTRVTGRHLPCARMYRRYGRRQSSTFSMPTWTSFQTTTSVSHFRSHPKPPLRLTLAPPLSLE